MKCKYCRHAIKDFHEVVIYVNPMKDTTFWHYDCFFYYNYSLEDKGDKK